MQNPSQDGRVNKQRLDSAVATIIRFKEEIGRRRSSRPLFPRNVFEEEKTKINQFFGAFVRLAADIDKILPTYFYFQNNINFVRTLVSFVSFVNFSSTARSSKYWTGGLRGSTTYIIAITTSYVYPRPQQLDEAVFNLQSSEG